MIKRLSLTSRLALLFAACTAVVSLIAGVLFNRASEAHFMELDQQQLESKLVALRSTLQGVASPEDLAQRTPQLRAELDHQPDLTLRITGAGQRWLDGAPHLPLPQAPGLHSLQYAGTDYRVFIAPLTPSQLDSPQLTLILDITHHQQQLITPHQRAETRIARSLILRINRRLFAAPTTDCSNRLHRSSALRAKNQNCK